jgi:SAM-dependent methyltransferase
MIKFRGRDGLKYRMLPLARLGFAVLGRRWTDFYAWLLNYQERNTRMKDVLARYRRDLTTTPRREKGLYDVSLGESYVEFLKQHGLQPHHDILDFGCGYGRVTIPLLRYLEPGRYVGVDLSTERIRMAWEYVDLEGLRDTKPSLHVTPRDNSFAYLGDRKFDFIWARAVLGHMPLQDVRDCLAGLRRLLKPGGVFIGDYDVTVGEGAQLEKTNVKTFKVPEPTMRDVVAQAGFVYGEIADWEEKLSLDERRSYLRMMRLEAVGSQ